jgi:hypothetical protein
MGFVIKKKKNPEKRVQMNTKQVSYEVGAETACAKQAQRHMISCDLTTRAETRTTQREHGPLLNYACIKLHNLIILCGS